MVANGEAADGLAAVTGAIDSLLSMGPKTRTIHGIGICSPGPLDPKTGVVINPPNLPCWRNFPLGKETARIYRVPVRIDNHANAAGLAEALWGAGSGHRNVFYATIGPRNRHRHGL
jgi:glucokinase